MQRNLKQASINIDVDTLCILAEAYNIPSQKCANITFSKIIPRMLDFFKIHDVSATFFVVGKYAKKKENKPIFSRMVSDGHEIANHTYNHKPNFSKLSFNEKVFEILECQDAVKEVTGIEPVGFRAPGWDIDSDSIKILEKNHFVYDSSICPSSFMQFIPKVMNFLNQKKTAWESIGRKEYSLAQKQPYHPDLNQIWSEGDSTLVELPVSTFSPFSIPFYATTFLTLHPAFFTPAFRLVNGRNNYLNFQLHSVDFIDQEKELPLYLNSTLKHPAMRFTLSRKFEFFQKSISLIKKEYAILTLKEIAQNIK